MSVRTDTSPLHGSLPAPSTGRLTRGWLAGAAVGVLGGMIGLGGPEVHDEIVRLRSMHRRLSPGQPILSRERASDAGLAVRLQTALTRNQRLAAEVTPLRERLAAAHGQLHDRQGTGGQAPRE